MIRLDTDKKSEDIKNDKGVIAITYLKEHKT